MTFFSDLFQFWGQVKISIIARCLKIVAGIVNINIFSEMSLFLL